MDAVDKFFKYVFLIASVAALVAASWFATDGWWAYRSTELDGLFLLWELFVGAYWFAFFLLVRSRWWSMSE